MGPVEVWVKSDAREPVGQEPRVLTGRHALSRPATGEQKLARFLACHSDVVVDGLSGVLRKLKTHGPPRFPLAHGCSIGGIAVGRKVIDFDSDNVAAPELAVDCEIEQGQITGLTLHLKLCPDGPDVLRPERRFRASQLALIPRDPLCSGLDRVLSVVHGRTPLLPRRRECTVGSDVGSCGRDQGLSGPTAIGAKPALLTPSGPSVSTCP